MLDGTPRGKHGDFIFSCDDGATPLVTRGTSPKERLDRLMLQALNQYGAPEKVELQPFRNHDLRRTGRTTLSRLGVDTETAEAVLAHRHAAGAIAATYDVWERLPEKRAALEKWADFLAGLTRPKLARAGHEDVG